MPAGVAGASGQVYIRCNLSDNATLVDCRPAKGEIRMLSHQVIYLDG
jgi:hypothetical protein